ncbi:LysE family translocator [Silicimonas algicola]|uniref:Threonine/homoserine/homoserine lactone efflux protein n=1 Tax=Silicimonas algicola TaxID=1826607 RepID=A0A316GCB4_9RHOB|nr:LysE family translocator [Silicimonas algicola]AZQ66257.1 LysE family translocator [Silicimonas algicola]PWK58571.1 threonine/homoserine/homoserine lactone efflux protein [Silicimonas algicola]
MTPDILLALAGFALVTSVTPGPNNLMLMASGANFGFRRSVPHMLGISLGHMLMMVLIGLGLFRVFEAYPVLHLAMKVLGGGYLLVLAWKILRAAPPEASEASGSPMSFLQAAAFQWVNPKGWFMALTAMTVYAPPDSALAVLAVSAVFAVVNLPSVSLWTLLGREVRRLLTSAARLRAFNWTMAALLVLSLATIL